VVAFVTVVDFVIELLLVVPDWLSSVGLGTGNGRETGTIIPLSSTIYPEGT
jgi:hypothetical protein